MRHFVLPTPLDIKDFREVRYVSEELQYPNDYFNCRKKAGGVWLEYFNNEESIGYIRYYVNTGQIGLFFIKNEYQNRGLGKQILSKTIQDMQQNGCEEVWTVTTCDHPFWSNVYDRSFTYRDPAHPSVTGDGYYMDIGDRYKVYYCQSPLLSPPFVYSTVYANQGL
jgi:GNAT superfamily N-acetyltransferase